MLKDTSTRETERLFLFRLAFPEQTFKVRAREKEDLEGSLLLSRKNRAMTFSCAKHKRLVESVGKKKIGKLGSSVRTKTDYMHMGG